MAHDVFISYSDHDKAVADAVCAALENARVRCWVAPRDVAYGRDWSESILKAIKESKAMVLVFSANTNTSKHVKREIERAVHHGVIIIPFRIENVEPSESLQLFLSLPHWLDALTPPLEKHLGILSETVTSIVRASTGPVPGEEQLPKEPRAPAPPVESQMGSGESHLSKMPRRYRWFAVAAIAALAVVAVAAGLYTKGRGSVVSQEAGNVPAQSESAANVPAGSGSAAQTPMAEKQPGSASLSRADADVSTKTEESATAPAETRVPTGPVGGQARETRTFAGIEFVWIPPGEFMMGSPEGEEGRSGGESPQHRVAISSGFWLGKYEVTQAQWQAVMGANPSFFKGDDSLPVGQVSWDDCQEFVRKLNGRGAGTFRLPSEAEWEYACRAGTTTPFAFGETISTDEANYNGNLTYGSGRKGVYREKTTPVGSFPPNAWGLYDMHGNVWEWCQDWYHDSYAGTPTDGSAWESPAGQSRVLRGGSWGDSPRRCRSANRSDNTPGNRYYGFGFRVVRTP